LKGTVAGKEGDFFNVTNYPLATFELTGIADMEGKSIVSGNLTIKEKTHAIEFLASITSDEYTVNLKSEPFQIDRTKWDVNYGSKTIFGNLGDKFINDMMELTIHIEARKS
jgi:polyisoprenoid-binding protein YceI